MEPETLFFETPQAFEAWLALHHANTPQGVLLKFAKKESGIPSLSYAGALDVALCYGWIDGMAKRIDETYYTQKFTPRRPRSMWSKRNITKVQELIDAGKMQSAGLAEIEAAKKDGRWDRAYDSPSNIEVPEDLILALKKNRKAAAFFKTLNKTNRFAVLFRIQTAKKLGTRAARIEKLVAMLEAGETIHPQAKPKAR